jgi:catechol 2,3-dioxygenase-like lactoylglutathione lyase family enzyme
MSSPSLTGPDFIAFVVDDVEAAGAFWRDIVGLERRGADVGEPQNGPFGRMFTLVAPGGFVVTVHAGAP